MPSYRLKGPLHAPVLALVHGFPFDQSLWKPQVGPLSRKFRVLTYDLRGMGQSPLGKAPQPLEAYVDDLLALLDHLKIASCAVAGLSMGGYIALRAVEREPGRFWALALCDTKSEPDSDEGKIGRAAGIKAIRSKGPKAFAAAMLPKLLARKGAHQKFLLRMMQKNGADGMANALSAMAGRSDTGRALKAYRGPVLALAGAKDGITPPALAKAMAKQARHGQFAVVPGAGHVSNLENPAAFNRLLLKFLEKAWGRGANPRR